MGIEGTVILIFIILLGIPSLALINFKTHAANVIWYNTRVFLMVIAIIILLTSLFFEAILPIFSSFRTIDWVVSIIFVSPLLAFSLPQKYLINRWIVKITVILVLTTSPTLIIASLILGYDVVVGYLIEILGVINLVTNNPIVQ